MLDGEFRPLPFAGDRRVPGHRFRRHLEVAVRSVQEALPALRQVLEHQAGRRGRRPVQGAPAGTGTILDVEAAIENCGVSLVLPLNPTIAIT